MVYACLDATCHLHFWKKWPGYFTCHCGNMGVEGTPKKSQHTKLTLEKKILPLLLLGFELATFRSRVRRSNQQAIPSNVTNYSILAISSYVSDPPYVHTDKQTMDSFQHFSHLNVWLDDLAPATGQTAPWRVGKFVTRVLNLVVRSTVAHYQLLACLTQGLRDDSDAGWCWTNFRWCGVNIVIVYDQGCSSSDPKYTLMAGSYLL